MHPTSLVIKVAIFSGVLVVFGASAAAAAGTLPDPVQNSVSAAASRVGVHVPPGDQTDVTTIAAVVSSTTSTTDVGTFSGTTTSTSTSAAPIAGGPVDDSHPTGTVVAPTTSSTTIDDHRQRGTSTTPVAPTKVEDKGVHQNRGRGADDAVTTSTAPAPVATTPSTVDDKGGESNESGKGKSGKRDKNDD